MGLQGGWGWLVVGAAFLVQVLTTGLQLAFGVMAAQIARHFRKENAGVHMEAGQFDSFDSIVIIFPYSQPQFPYLQHVVT